MRHSLFYWCVTGFVAGVVFCSLGFFNFKITGLLFFISSLALVVLVFKKKVFTQDPVKTHTVFFVMCVVIFASALAMIQYKLFILDGPDERLSDLAGKVRTFEGVVVSESDVRENDTRFVVELQKIVDQDKQETPLKKTNVLINDNAYSRLAYGDRVEMIGSLVIPENFETDVGRTFDYISYLSQQKVFFQIKNPEIEVLEKHQANKLYEVLFSVKSAFIKKLDELIPFPESRLGAGLVVAGKRSLPKQVLDEFQLSGTMQVIVLSGFNVTIIAQALVSILSFLPKKIAAMFGALGIILFTIVAGASATIVRASIMALIVIVAQLSKRDYNVSRGLVTAGVIMLWFNPMILFFNPSFQISFLATIGLIHFSPLLKKSFMWVPEKFKLREAVLSTIATQIFVTPFLLFTSGQVSLVSLPANLLLFLVVPLTMLICFMAGLLAFINTFLALPLGYFAFVLLWYELKIVHIFASFPFASISLPPFPTWLLLGIYVCFSVMIVRFYRKEAKEATAPAFAKALAGRHETRNSKSYWR